MTLASEKKILVVDDEPDVRMFLATYLKDAGFQVRTAIDGLDALEKLEAFTPDLMTLDMVMPKLSGIQLIRKLRKMDKWSNLPIIVITAHAHDELGSEEIKGFNAIVSGLRPRITMEKPISPHKLIKVISDILKMDISDTPPVPLSFSEKDKLVSLLESADEDTLKKVRDLLGQKES